ncbi:glycosyltransferase [Cellulomonas sp. PSBB021]|uniref:glycosyltransferase n=1 Tax=Cellulomonas sp. PSBB021 TaxID=2003551 RepID=UPI001E42EE34|nr:glycosyltransferase [Cellulomonas sp. PSBB021]
MSIVTSGHDVADARLHREVAALSRRGLEVEVLGLGQAAAGPPEASTRSWRRGGGLRRSWHALTLPLRARGDVLVALDPDSAAGVWLARGLRRLTGRRIAVVTDVHEDYELLLQDRPWASGVRGALASVWARLGIRAAQRADLLVVADQHLMTDVERRLVVRNLADTSMLPGPTAPGPTPRALYIGDLRRSRGLFAMLDAVEAAPGWELDLVGPIAPADREEFLERLASPVLAECVRWHGRQPPREAWTLARGAWVGLLLLDQTPAFRDAIPSKLYEYLACGLAVVATDLPRSARVVRESAAGVVVDDAAGAAEALRTWQADLGGFSRVRDAAVAAGGAYVAEDDLSAFADAVAALVKTPVAAGV